MYFFEIFCPVFNPFSKIPEVTFETTLVCCFEKIINKLKKNKKLMLETCKRSFREILKFEMEKFCSNFRDILSKSEENIRVSAKQFS